tara:strand:+ start:1244 stop:1573 length:330 start_codon:yes stop_codon:yes gene_type:complete
MKKILGSPIDTIEDLQEEEEIKINRKEHFSGDTWFLNPAALADKATMGIEDDILKFLLAFTVGVLAVVVYFIVFIITVIILAGSGFFLFEFLPNKIWDMYKSFRGVKED